MKLKILNKLINHELYRNMVFLYIAHFTRYLFPLITIPYLCRVLGIENYGILVFAQAYGSYMSTLIMFSFNLSATREVSRQRNSPINLSNILSGVISSQIILATIAIGITAILLNLIPLFRDNQVLLWTVTFSGIINGMNLLWYFRGMEKMKIVALLEIMGRVIATLSIFLIVHRPEHMWRIPLMNVVAGFLAMIFSLYIAYQNKQFVFSSISKIWEIFKTGWILFLARLGSTMLSVSSIFVVGISQPPIIIGYFAGAIKISKAFHQLLIPAVRSLYPYITNKVSGKSKGSILLIRRVLIGMSILGGGLSLMLFCFSNILVNIVLGKEFTLAIPLLKVLSLTPLLISISFCFQQWMLSLKMDFSYSIITVMVGILSFILAFLLIPYFGNMGAAWTIILSRVIYIVVYLLILRQLKLDPFLSKLT